MLDSQLLNAREHGASPLLSYGKQTISYSDFVEKVEQLSASLSDKVPARSVAVLNCENPLYFYSLLFAAHKSNLVCILPNKDFLGGKTPFNFASHVLSLDESGLKVDARESFNPVKLDDDVEAVLFSSGSTGAPKGACHRFDHFFMNAESVNKLVHYKTSMTPLKPYLVSALAHFMCHFLLGEHIVFFDDDISDEAFTTLSEKFPQAGFVSSPIHIMKCAGKFSPDAKPAYFFSSGDFIYAQTVNKLFEIYPDSIFYKVYGLAELGGRFFVNVLTAGASEQEINGAGQTIEGTKCQTEENQIYVSSDFLFSGYLREDSFESSQNPHPTGDLCSQENGITTLTGRATEEIKVGGQKVLLSLISKKLETLIEPNTFAVVPQPHPIFGNLISLVVTDKNLKRSELQTRLKTTLEKSEIPHNYFYTEDLPRTASGKVDKKQTKEAIGSYQRLI